MGRFPQHQAKKGSQRWIQKLVNEQPGILNSQIRSAFNFSKEEDIQWLSPLKSDEYAEYRDQAFLDRLKVKLEKTPLAQFWPKGGPQWDALGKSSVGKLLLVEAKSHISELISKSQAEDKASIKMIQKSLEETGCYLNSRVNAAWLQSFYQYTNRLAHLYLLRKNDLQAYLIHVYFLNDVEMNGPVTLHEWAGAIKLLNSCLRIKKHRLQEFMTSVYIHVNTLQ